MRKCNITGRSERNDEVEGDCRMVLSSVVAANEMRAALPASYLSLSMVPFASISLGMGALSWFLPRRVFLAVDNLLYSSYMRMCLFVFENVAATRVGFPSNRSHLSYVSGIATFCTETLYTHKLLHLCCWILRNTIDGNARLWGYQLALTRAASWLCRGGGRRCSGLRANGSHAYPGIWGREGTGSGREVLLSEGEFRAPTSVGERWKNFLATWSSGKATRWNLYISTALTAVDIKKSTLICF